MFSRFLNVLVLSLAGGGVALALHAGEGSGSRSSCGWCLESAIAAPTHNLLSSRDGLWCQRPRAALLALLSSPCVLGFGLEKEMRENERRGKEEGKGIDKEWAGKGLLA